MTHEWFKPWGWIYRPASWQAVILVLLAVVFCVQVFIAVDRRSHSVSDTLYGVFPFVIPCLMLLNWVASKTSPAARSDSPSSTETAAGRPG
jgi:hypothetical protein